MAANPAEPVKAVCLGRRIDDNLRKAIGYILAVHVPIAGMSLIPVLFGWPVVLGPRNSLARRRAIARARRAIGRRAVYAQRAQSDKASIDAVGFTRWRS